MNLSSPPSAEQGLDVHRRLCAGSRTATAELCAAYLPYLLAWLERVEPRADPHLRTQAAEDALLKLAQVPWSYRPERGGLATYLRMSARCDLSNAERSERRHHRLRISLAIVEDSPQAGKYLGREDAAPIEPIPALQGLDEKERRVLELIAEGERRTEAFAAVLELSNLSPAEQFGEVKRAKDRIKKRARRAGGLRERSA